MADTIPGNATSTQSLAVGTAASSAIDYAGDTDWWKVNLTYGYQYQVWLEGYTSSKGTLADPYLAMYNSVGVFQFANNDASFLSYYSYATVVPNSTGIYFLSAEANGNGAIGSYTITIWQDELASTASAAIVPVNSISDSGHLGWQGDVSDWYAVNLTAGVLYQFDMIGSADDGALAGLTLADPYLILKNGTGVQLIADDESGLSHNARIFYTPTASGTYFLDAQEYGNNATGTYKLIVNSNPIFGTLTLGTAQTGVIGFAGEVGLYRVVLAAGVAYAFTVDGITLPDPYLEILDLNGATQYSADGGGTGLSAYLTFTPSSGGTYYLAARETGNNATGSFSARAWQLPSVSIADSSVVEGNSGTNNLVFTVTLSTASPVPVGVTASTSGTATATVSVDYVPTSSTITFAPGQTSASFIVPVRGDLLFEPTESLHVLLSSPTNASLGVSDAYGLIKDNDAPYALPTDTFLTLQWHLYPVTGINVFPVWSDYTGHGIRVVVFDQGIDPSHPDLDGNLLTGFGRNASNLSMGGAPVLSTDNHGTMVAGAIAAERNGIGIVGVAYGANLAPIYSPLSLSGLGSQIANAYSYATNFDVLNDSWGFANGFSSGQTWAFYDNFSGPSFSTAGAALANLATGGRHTLGTVVVQSAGNSFGVGDDTNLHNFQNSQYIITVAATDYAGNVTSYSSPGASVLVAAPGGGGTDLLSDIITTDRVGAAGNDPSDYASTAGTSFSAPIVSGVVALMLEANPKLGYRDVQEILAYSAREIGSTNNDWRYNGATNWNGGGLHYDALEHNLGYGLVDALAAVRLAETWPSISHTASNRLQVSATHSLAIAIPDGGGINALAGAFDTISVTQAIDVERAEVTLNVTHPYVGDLSVLLTSPSGTTSFLLWRPQQNPLSAYGTNQDNIHFTFDTVLNWGESSVGSWKLAVYDSAYGDIGTLDSWTLNLIGKSASSDDTYIYTNEFSDAVADQAARATLSDSGGTDTINASACTANLVLNLNPGSVSTIDGRSLTIATGTIIEKALGGDGNDTITGNSANNLLSGMRGNDSIDGGAGIDTAVYGVGRTSVSLTKTSTGFTLTDNSKVAGTDTLQNIERIKFLDGAIALDVGATQAAGQTVMLLGAVLPGRLVFDASKQALLGAAIDLFDQGYSLQTLSGAVMRLPIWDVLTQKAAPSNTDIAIYLLKNVNGVAPDATTLANAVNSLNTETDFATQGNFLWHLAESAANQTRIDLVGLATTGLVYGW